MSRAYKFHDPHGTCFITFATVAWVDVFTRRRYSEVLIDSLGHCQQHKGLALYAWVIMTNHVHLIARAAGPITLPEILRDLKKYTSKRILAMITDEPGESRKAWMLRIFHEAGAANPHNTHYQFWQQHNKPIALGNNAMLARYSQYLQEPR